MSISRTFQSCLRRSFMSSSHIGFPFKSSLKNLMAYSILTPLYTFLLVVFSDSMLPSLVNMVHSMP